MSNLLPCSACKRHHRLGEPVCPFCGSTVAPATKRNGMGKAIGRLAFLMVGSALAAGCGADSDDDNATSESEGQTSPDGTNGSGASSMGASTGADDSSVDEGEPSEGAGGMSGEIILDPRDDVRGAGGATTGPVPSVVALYGAPPSTGRSE
jgi:hypothetical protein